MNTVKEVWKPIKGYEDYYSVSNLGNVRNDKTHRVLTVVTSCSRGYFYVDWKHKRGKIGIRRVFKKSNAKCVTTIERIPVA